MVNIADQPFMTAGDQLTHHKMILFTDWSLTSSDDKLTSTGFICRLTYHSLHQLVLGKELHRHFMLTFVVFYIFWSCRLFPAEIATHLSLGNNFTSNQLSHRFDNSESNDNDARTNADNTAIMIYVK